MQIRTFCGMVALLGATVVAAMNGGCATEPKAEDQADFVARATSSRAWFERSVVGLEQQIDGAAGYIIFPDVAQWGILITGGTFGRGMLCRADDTQIGWAAINVGSLGLQAGVQGFRMLMVLENEAEVQEFMKGKWAGSVTGVAVAGEAGGSGAAPFVGGVAAYQGANSGLMAGVNVGLNHIRYKPLDAP